MGTSLCRAHEKSPAQTRHSLLASATVAPRSTAAAQASPAAPLTAAITNPPVATLLDNGAFASRAFGTRAASASFSSARRSGSAIALKRAPNSFASFASPCTLLFRSALRPCNGRAKRSNHRAVADRAGRTEDGHRTVPQMPRLCCYAMELAPNSPNHKTAADAIHATAKIRKCRQHHRGDNPSRRSIGRHAREWYGWILDAETPFYRGVKEIAELGSDGRTAAAATGSHLSVSAGSALFGANTTNLPPR